MKCAWLVLALCASLVGAQEDKKTDVIGPREPTKQTKPAKPAKAEDNPFGVDLGPGAPGEKANPEPTAAELESFKSATRSSDLGRIDWLAGARDTIIAFAERWGTSPMKWTEADFKVRLAVLKKLVQAHPALFHRYCSQFTDAMRLYSVCETDPTKFGARLASVAEASSLFYSDLPGCVSASLDAFFAQEKLAKATKQQKILFIKNLVLPKINGNWAKEARAYLEDLQK